MKSIADSAQLLKVIKRAALDAVEAGKPARFTYGQVLSAQPLQIQIHQKLILSKEFLIVPQSLTDYEVELESKEGRIQTYTLKNALKGGDLVILLQQQGGQRYLVLDRTSRKTNYQKSIGK